MRIRGTWLEGCLERLDDELTQRGIVIRPHAWISDEWFSPDSTPGIAIPFYLAHPRLMRLERKMHPRSGGRHAAGLHAHPAPRGRPRRPARLPAPSPPALAAALRALLAALPAATIGRTRPAGSYVQHLRLWYAQSHPDEDFAETFAVWLQPALQLAQALCRLAGAEEAGICRRTDGRDRRRETAAHLSRGGRSAQPASSGRWPSTIAASRRSTCVEPAADLRPRPPPPVHRRPRGIRGAGGLDLPPPQSRRDPPHRVALDRRVPANAGFAFSTT